MPPRYPIADDQKAKLLGILSEAVGINSQRTNAEIDLLLRRLNVVYYGPPGTGKTFSALQVRQEWLRRYGPTSVVLTTFHPSYSYEDFIIGFRPDPQNPGQFVLTDGLLLKACAVARQFMKEDGVTNPRRVLLLIDEINRGDVARIFGELITFIERDKRGLPFRLSQRPDPPVDIPDNLVVLGTMNTADKSISLLDVAMRRRFAFVEFRPDPNYFAASKLWLAEVDGLSLSSLLINLNRRLEMQGVDTERRVGHALLQVPSDSSDPVGALLERIRFDVYPLIQEFCYFEKDRIRSVLSDLVDTDGVYRAGANQNELIGVLKAITQAAPAAPAVQALNQPSQPGTNAG
ncbi:MAG TPA: AAA family ATPase [Nitrospira sp.]|nr:AAA family ATPase [Nitrospira sp.]